MAINATDREQVLGDQVGQSFPTAWIASEEDPVIAGRLVAIEPGRTQYGPTNIAILEQRDGAQRSVWVMFEVLRSEFARWQPQIGEVVAIGYHGLQIVPDGNDWKRFRVAVDRTMQDFDWSTLAEQVAPPPSVGPSFDWNESGNQVAPEPNGHREAFPPSSAQTDDIPF